MNRELDELLGVYALDAVDADERARLDAYVATDPDARREVDELRETAAMLALTQSGSDSAPPELWDRIAASISEPVVADAPVADAPVTDELVARRARRSFARPLLAAAAAIALLAGGAVAMRLRDDSRGGTTDLAAAYRNAAHAGTEVTIRDDGGRALAHVAYTGAGNGYLRVDDLAALPADAVYQLWVIPEGSETPLSAGVLGSRPGLVAFHWSGAAKTFAISRERAPGAQAPGTVLGAGSL